MGKLSFKALEGGLFEILRSWKDFTLSELQFRKGMGELLRQKVCPCLRRPTNARRSGGFAEVGAATRRQAQAFPKGIPMSVCSNLFQYQGQFLTVESMR
jgi:hypothetical protein